MAPATIHQRLSTVCRLYRFANIEGRIGSNPAQYVRRPKVHRSQARGVDRFELGRILFAAEPFDRAHAALAVLLGLIGLRVSETCSAKIEDLALERGHRTLRIVGKGSTPAVTPLSLARHAPWASRLVSACAVRSRSGATVKPLTGGPPTVGCGPSASEPGSGSCTPTCSDRPSIRPPSTLESRCARSRSQLVTPIPER